MEIKSGEKSTALDRAREASAAMRAAGIKPQKFDPIEAAKRNPKSRSLAIRAKCWDCQGAGADPGTRAGIAECPSTTCPLWSVRPYQAKASGDGA